MVTLEQIAELETLSEQAWRALEHAENSLDSGSCDRAVSRCTAHLQHPAMSEAPAELQLMALGLAGSAYSARYEAREDPADLDKIIGLNRQVLKQAPPGWDGLGLHLTQLGNACSSRFKLTRGAEDLEGAIDAYRRSVEEAGSNPEQRAGRLTNLGTGLKERFDRTGDPADIAQAVEALETAVALTTDDSPYLAMFLMNLGYGLRARAAVRRAEHDHESAEADLDAAIAGYRQAEALGDAPAALEMNLASALRERFGSDGDAADLDRSIEARRREVAVAPEGQPVSHQHLFDLAGLYRRRYRQESRIGDLAAASDAYRSAFERARGRDFREAIEAAKGWGETAAALHAWGDAAEAYSGALEVGDRLFRERHHLDDLEDVLGTLRGLPAEAAYALARADKLEEAVVTLERGRVRLLDQAFQRHRADLEKLGPELQQRYRMALDMSSLARAVGADSVSPAAEEELQGVLAEIRERDGYERFLEPPSFDEIASVAASGPLVYLLAAYTGGLGLIVRTDRTIRPVWLPDLLAGMLEIDLQIFQADYDHRNLPPTEEEPAPAQQWRDTIEKTTKRLWEIAMGPVVEALGRASRATLIPTGPLGLLPLHAAWTEDPARSSGRRYLIDDLLITHAPSARALATPQQGSADPPADAILAVADSRLSYAELEVEWVSRPFSERAQVLTDEAATRSAVLKALRQPARDLSAYGTACPVLHFCCHGTADLVEPLRSGLLLAEDEVLSLRDLMQARLPFARLAVLSACESAMVGERLPDEALGLPAGLLQAGVVGVIGTSWAVPDAISTALLLGRFYQLWRSDGPEPAEAMRQAQLWLRDAPNEEIAEHFPEVLELLELAGPDCKAKRNLWLTAPDPDKERTHPAAWAPFVFVGR